MSRDENYGSQRNLNSPEPPTGGRPGVLTILKDMFGIGRGVTIGGVLAVAVVVAGALLFCMKSAPSKTIVLTSGPEGSVFETNAWRYATALARDGIKLKVLTSRGSQDNLERLEDRRVRVDAGFVQTGVTNRGMDKLVSLGTVSYQPLLLFYRGAPVDLLSAFAGKRLAIGQEGSGTRSLSLTLLEANGIRTNSTLLDWEPKQSAAGLVAGNVDAVFLMGEDASPAVMRELLRSPDVHLFSFKQAAAYTRRFNYLSALVLPQGSIDFGKNIPAQDVSLIGPTVELVAREKLHPALSDLLLEAARQVHGRPTLLQRKNEFPAPIEHDIRLSPDAARFYKSGKSFFYRFLPFWLASVTSQILVVFVPLVLVLVPALRSIPVIYRWRGRAPIYKRYRALLKLERELFNSPDPARRAEWHARLDKIEDGVNRMRVPASFADLFYGLRGHIEFVRKLVDDATGMPVSDQRQPAGRS